jgi:hypothetical protein
MSDRYVPAQHRRFLVGQLFNANQALGRAVVDVSRAAIAEPSSRDGRDVDERIIEALAQCDRAIEALHKAKRHALHGYPS